MHTDDDQIRISETVDRSDPLTVDVVLEVHETIASVQEVDGFVRVRFRVPVAEWDAVLGRRMGPPSPDPTRKQIEAYLRQSQPWECDGGCWHYGPDSYEASFYLDEPAPVVVGKIATAEGRTPAEAATRIATPPSPTITACPFCAAEGPATTPAITPARSPAAPRRPGEPRAPRPRRPWR